MENPVPLPALVIDAASETVAVGLEVEAAPCGTHWRRQTQEAGVGIFACLAELLRVTHLRLADVRCTIFCEGPGSILGVRIASMAIRTWRAIGVPAEVPCYGYRSLELFAADIRESGSTGQFAVVSDARRSTWNIMKVDNEGQFDMIRRVGSTELNPRSLSIYHPAGFPAWQPLPDHAMSAPYRPERIILLNRLYPLLRPCSKPDAFLTEVPEYRKTARPPWVPPLSQA